MKKYNYQTELTKDNYNWIQVVFIIIFCWVGITTSIQAFKCPKTTETELFLHIPKSFVLSFESS